MSIAISTFSYRCKNEIRDAKTQARDQTGRDRVPFGPALPRSCRSRVGKTIGYHRTAREVNWNRPSPSRPLHHPMNARIAIYHLIELGVVTR